MHALTKELKQALAEYPRKTWVSKTDGGAWVKVAGTGGGWDDWRERATGIMNEARAFLEAKGYRCECRGKPGTAGEFFIDVER